MLKMFKIVVKMLENFMSLVPFPNFASQTKTYTYSTAGLKTVLYPINVWFHAKDPYNMNWIRKL